MGDISPLPIEKLKIFPQTLRHFYCNVNIGYLEQNDIPLLKSSLVNLLSNTFKISVEVLVKLLKAKRGAFCARSRATGNKSNEV